MELMKYCMWEDRAKLSGLGLMLMSGLIVTCNKTKIKKPGQDNVLTFRFKRYLRLFTSIFVNSVEIVALFFNF